ncbi:MAG: hypothetical protein ACOY93_02005 [Bacillota bacterium]
MPAPVGIDSAYGKLWAGPTRTYGAEKYPAARPLGPAGAYPAAGYPGPYGAYPAAPLPGPGPTGTYAGAIFLGPEAHPSFLETAMQLGPALASVLPAIQGLLQLPALLMEVGESAELLARWTESLAMLEVADRSGSEPPDADGLSSGGGSPGETAGGDSPAEEG